MLKNASSLAIVGLDTAENGPSKVRQVTNRIDAIIGTPLELARGGGHHRIAEMLEAAQRGGHAVAWAVLQKRKKPGRQKKRERTAFISE